MSGIISRVNNDIIETYQGQDAQGDVGDSGVLSALADIALSVKSPQFGAKGDGVTDDTLAIQKAVNVIQAGTHLIFPLGEYLITQPIVFANLSDFSIEMYGYVRTNAISPIFALGTSAGFSFQGCTRFNIKPHFRNVKSGDRGYQIELINSSHARIVNGTIDLINADNTSSSAFLQIRTNTNNITISNNNIRCNWGIVSDGSAGISDITIQGNTFYGNKGQGSGCDLIEFNQPTNAASNISVVGNVLSHTDTASGGGIGIGFANCQHITIANNVLHDIGHDGIHVEDRSAYFTISGNTITGTGGYCISAITNTTNGIIQNNTLVQNYGSGTANTVMAITGLNSSSVQSDIIIKDNVIDGYSTTTTAYALLVTYTQNSVIENNTIKNARYGASIDSPNGGMEIRRNRFKYTSTVGLTVGNTFANSIIEDNSYSGNTGWDFQDNSSGTNIRVVEYRSALPTGRKSFYRGGALVKLNGNTNYQNNDTWLNTYQGWNGIWRKQGTMMYDSVPATAYGGVNYWNLGEVIWAANPVSSGYEGQVCVTAGTSGTYSEGLTATSNGTATITLSGNTSVLNVGDYLTFGNGVVARVYDVNGNTLTMDRNITTGSAMSISYRNPVFKTFGVISA